jgi:hypothetical protein
MYIVKLAMVERIIDWFPLEDIRHLFPVCVQVGGNAHDVFCGSSPQWTMSIIIIRTALEAVTNQLPCVTILVTLSVTTERPVESCDAVT